MVDPPTPAPGSDEAVKAAIAEALRAQQPSDDAAGAYAALAQIRASMRPDDPENLFYGRHDLVAQQEARLKAVIAERGLVEPRAPTPQQIAAAKVDRSYSMIGQEVHPTLAGMLDAELDKIAASGELGRRTAALRAEIGYQVHDALVAKAKSVTENWRPEMAAHLGTLRTLAGVADYRARYAAAKGRIR